ncbi:aldehyde dehydrogenase (NADP(+)) [Egicoccus sp. AB-alg2]|uniref:aldehyde dehydrogenase (NADP(+)) n=1 Tax=Egicoccus sp. AB-alg2 TaxID=3242693 RepID=UPI00359CFE60
MSEIKITGANLIAGTHSTEGSQLFQARNPTTGDLLDPIFTEATPLEVARATGAAGEAYRELRTWNGPRLAELLRQMSAQLLDVDGQLLQTAHDETGLPIEPRLRGELARTCAQFDMFADLVTSGEHRDVVIDHADATLSPPRPDLRRMRIGVGPVAVFGASNFPLAFSVPGGDTASALAAGCPVVIKAHPSHPATSEMAATALLRAVELVGAPAGSVSLVHGLGHEVGEALVTSEEIRSVGFTGSPAGGQALAKLAAGRPHPIPVHAEMGSLNPVLVTPRALAVRGREIAEQLASSLKMGVGQFCTSPGLVFVPSGEDGDRFVDALADQLRSTGEGVLLNQGILGALSRRLATTRAVDGVTTLLDGGAQPTDGPVTCAPSLFSVDLDAYRASDHLREEHFGPASIVVRYDEGRLPEVVPTLEGQLTVTLQAEPEDVADLVDLRADLMEIAGRVLFNGFPTGVSVTAAQHHGGPFPAASDPRFTSVGTKAIDRFLRPVTFQDVPDPLLPDELKEANPLNVPRRVDGRLRG